MSISIEVKEIAIEEGNSSPRKLVTFLTSLTYGVLVYVIKNVPKVRSFNLYLIGSPDAPDARKVRQKIDEVEVAQELAD